MKKITLLTAAIFSLMTVSAQLSPINLFDGEDGTFLVPARFQPQSSEAIAVVSNPLQNGANSSDNVMMVTPMKGEDATVPGNRCILMIRINDSQTAAGDKIEVAGYSHLTMKYYAPEISGSIIRVQWNASENTITELNPGGSEIGNWEVLNFEFPNSTTNWQKFQIMLNQNQSWTENSDNVMYLDDIMVESNTTGISSVNSTSLNSYFMNRDGQTTICIQPAAASDACVELYSASGQKLKTLFNGNISSLTEIPVNVQTGIYFACISDGQGMQTLKLMVK